jgi:hypothetical protein
MLRDEPNDPVPHKWAGRTVYRYEVIDASESFAERVPVGTHVVHIDRPERNGERVWNFFDFRTNEETGWFRGRLVERGAMVGDKFEPEVIEHAG